MIAWAGVDWGSLAPTIVSIAGGALASGAGWLLLRWFRRRDERADAEQKFREFTFESATSYQRMVLEDLQKCEEDRRRLRQELMAERRSRRHNGATPEEPTQRGQHEA